jgi:peptidyl-prolyl cis-trans isomerase A (cyclophilin A)
MAYWVTMRRFCWLALSAAACLALGGCSSPDETTKKTLVSTAPKVEKTPDVFQATLETSKGPVVVEIHRDWAPIGVDHFYSLAKTGYYDGNRFFRVTRAYAQFGINGNPQTSSLWSTAYLPDDAVKQSNKKGTLTYAHLGANNRTTQLFFNRKDNQDLDKSGFAPIGRVVTGMDVVDSLYDSYGDMPPRGQGPDPSKIEVQGNSYLEGHFPRLDFIKKVTIQ